MYTLSGRDAVEIMIRILLYSLCGHFWQKSQYIFYLYNSNCFFVIASFLPSVFIKMSSRSFNLSLRVGYYYLDGYELCQWMNMCTDSIRGPLFIKLLEFTYIQEENMSSTGCCVECCCCCCCCCCLGLEDGEHGREREMVFIRCQLYAVFDRLFQ